MAIPAYRLPPEVEAGASSGGPEFEDSIQPGISGKEQRGEIAELCRALYDISYSILSSTDPVGSYRAVRAMFYAHRRLYPFRFRMPDDYEANNDKFGEGNGSATAFQLSKTYDPAQLLLGTPGTLTYTREIYLFGTTPVIKVNNVTVATPADYSINSTGLVTFTSPPTNGHDLTWTGEFDIPVRFDTKHFPAVFREADIIQIGSILIREVIGVEELSL